MSDDLLETLRELINHQVNFAGLRAIFLESPKAMRIDPAFQHSLLKSMAYADECVERDLPAVVYMFLVVTYAEVLHIVQCPTCREAWTKMEARLTESRAQ